MEPWYKVRRALPACRQAGGGVEVTACEGVEGETKMTTWSVRSLIQRVKVPGRQSGYSVA